MATKNIFDNQPDESILDLCGLNTQRQLDIEAETEDELRRMELKAFLELF